MAKRMWGRSIAAVLLIVIWSLAVAIAVSMLTEWSQALTLVVSIPLAVSGAIVILYLLMERRR